MAKSKRTRRARNKIQDSSQGNLVKADPVFEPAIEARRTNTQRVTRSTLFTAELEEVIDIIARDRVYRAMLARWGRNLLGGPKGNGE